MIQIAAFAILVMYIAYMQKETLVDVIPIAVCLFTMALFGLSFVNGLLWSDYLAIAVCIAALIWLFVKKEDRQKFLDFLREEFTKPYTIAAMVLLTAVPLLTSQKAVSWWDDYNFWATDVKSIFYLNGFAEKYQNVAPEFGDYPPGTQMMKWWFLHMNPSEFKEGLMFSGYHFMNLAFLVPLLKHLDRKSSWLTIPAAVVLWIFPTSVEVFGIDGFCADLTMAVVYGAFLTAVLDCKGHSRLFYYGRQALFLMMIVICKNTGFIWVAFGLLFAYGCRFFWYGRKTEDRDEEKKLLFDKAGLICMTALPVLTEMIWLGFCLLNRRVAKLTGTAVKMVTGSMNIPEVRNEMLDSFITAFISYPLHRSDTPAIDLSPLALYLLFPVFLFLLYRSGRLLKRQGWYLGIFLAINGLCFYAINLISHLTIFASELQYLDPYGMVSSIERYGAPFTIGGLYLMADLVMGRESERAGVWAEKNPKFRWLVKNSGVLICILFVLLTADHASAYRGVIGYREKTADILQERDEIVDEQAEVFLQKVGAGRSGSGKRVLYLRDISDSRWTRNPYIAFEAAPVSVMYGNLDGKTAVGADVIRAIDEAHAGYLYVDEIIDGEDIFEGLTNGELFEYSCLYEVYVENSQVLLRKADLSY